MQISASSHIRQAEHELFRRKSTNSLELMNKIIARMGRAWESSPYADYFTHIVVYAGTGNNAGDALGWAVDLNLPTTLRQVGRLTYEAKYHYDRLHDFQEELPDYAPHTRLLIIDGLLGTGVTDVLRPVYREYVQEMNELRRRYPLSRVVSIDIPSGMDCDAGTPLPVAVYADMTMSIGCVKPGLLTDVGTQYTGRIIPIEMPEIEWQDERISVLDAPLLRSWCPQRGYDRYKNQLGHVAIIAGSRGYLGAAQLAAEAAQATGVGLVTLYCRDEAYELLAVRVAPEIMVRPLSQYDLTREKGYDSLLIGPGLGVLDEAEVALLERILSQASCSVVLDADGINLAARRRWRLSSKVLLTPHPGEMARLAGPMPDSRLKWVQDFVAQHEAALLLKGARSMIASKEALYYNATGGPFMANAGQGDVLGGCIAGLCAQGYELVKAAASGAWLCGLAAERAQVLAGLAPAIRASQVIEQLPRCLVDLG